MMLEIYTFTCTDTTMTSALEGIQDGVNHLLSDLKEEVQSIQLQTCSHWRNQSAGNDCDDDYTATIMVVVRRLGNAG
jgi:hypothetical protein